YNLGLLPTKESTTSSIHHNYDACPGLQSPFFFQEVLDFGERHLSLLIRSLAAGSAILNYYRLAKAKAKLEIPADRKPFADMATIALSLLPTGSQAGLYIHWLQVTGDEVIYHMHLVHTYGLNTDEELERFRAAFLNIMDWGLFERKEAYCDVLKKLAPSLGEDKDKELTVDLEDDNDQPSKMVEGGPKVMIPLPIGGRGEQGERI
ncbi:MAG: hypothetical protein Q9168_002754, partial [Polycauliona sp. 1 TL-2023]